MKTSTLIKQILDQEIDPAFAQRAEYILKAVSRNKPKRVLDAGCGRGFYTKMLSLLPKSVGIKEIVGIDVSSTYVHRAKNITSHDKRVTVKKGSIYKIPYPDNHFDCVISSEVLEHLTDDHKAVQEIYRVLKPQGIFIVSVPHAQFPFLWDPLNWLLMKLFRTHIHKDIWWLAGIWADHERLYKDYQLQHLLKENGFKTRKLQRIVHWCWPFSHFVLYGIGKNIVERMGGDEFDRFNFDKQSGLSRMLAAFMSFPSRLLDNKLPKKSSMGLCIVGKKTALHKKSK